MLSSFNSHPKYAILSTEFLRSPRHRQNLPKLSFGDLQATARRSQSKHGPNSNLTPEMDSWGPQTPKSNLPFHFGPTLFCDRQTLWHFLRDSRHRPEISNRSRANLTFSNGHNFLVSARNGLIPSFSSSPQSALPLQRELAISETMKFHYHGEPLAIKSDRKKIGREGS